ncbi:MAG: glucose-6-phosphate isomerase [Bacteroidales bacterium]|nr:glucose-6-phosphate isomerase [Bacteroidales bacterium]
MLKFSSVRCNSFINNADVVKYVAKAKDALAVLNDETGAGNDFLGWKRIASSTPESLIADFEAIRDKWIAKGVDLVVVIGIGGSYLGAKCAVEAFKHNFIHSGKAPEIVFAGHNLSEDYLAELEDYMNLKNVATICISKSGTTTEPAVAFRLVKAYIEAKYADAKERIVAITDAKKGALKTLATEQGYASFVIADNVGGRFSVLSPVGLLPICVAGYDIRALLKGAADMEEVCLSSSEENPSLQYAAIRNLLYSENKKSTEVLVTYNPKLTFFAEWWKQLFGESEGKDCKGIYPASVAFTTDLHSMGQFIQDGSRIMFETVISVENAARKVVIGKDEANLDGLNFLAGKRLEHCNKMAELGTKLAHIDGGVPQIEISIEKIDEYNIGQLFYFFEAACGISGYMLGVNPFNQPGVEAYKKNMFALLEKPGYEAQAAALKARL